MVTKTTSLADPPPNQLEWRFHRPQPSLSTSFHFSRGPLPRTVLHIFLFYGRSALMGGLIGVNLFEELLDLFRCVEVHLPNALFRRSSDSAIWEMVLGWRSTSAAYSLSVM